MHQLIDLTDAVARARRGLRRDLIELCGQLNGAGLVVPLASLSRVPPSAGARGFRISKDAVVPVHLMPDGAGFQYVVLFTRSDYVGPFAQRLGWQTDDGPIKTSTIPALKALMYAFELIDGERIPGLVINPFDGRELGLYPLEIKGILEGNPIPLLHYAQSAPQQPDESLLVRTPDPALAAPLRQILDRVVKLDKRIQRIDLVQTLNQDRGLQYEWTVDVWPAPNVHVAPLEQMLLQACAGRIPPPGELTVFFEQGLAGDPAPDAAAPPTTPQPPVARIEPPIEPIGRERVPMEVGSDLELDADDDSALLLESDDDPPLELDDDLGVGSVHELSRPGLPVSQQVINPAQHRDHLRRSGPQRIEGTGVMVEKSIVLRENTLFPQIFGDLGKQKFLLTRKHFLKMERDDYAPKWLKTGVYESRPGETRNNWAYVTSGLSDLWEGRPNDWKGMHFELVIQTRERSPWALEFLHMVMAQQLLLLGSYIWEPWEFHRVIRMPFPLTEGKPTRLKHLLTVVPIDFQREFELVTGNNDLIVLLGITDEEAQYANARGAGELLKLLDSAGHVPFTDPARRSLF